MWPQGPEGWGMSWENWEQRRGQCDFSHSFWLLG